MKTLLPVLGAAAAILLSGCTDEPTRPLSEPLQNESRRFATLSAEDRGELREALELARQHSIRALDRREAADGVRDALARVTERLDQDDRSGFEHAVAKARLAIARYRTAAGDGDASAVALEALSLTLDHALAMEARKP